MTLYNEKKFGKEYYESGNYESYRARKFDNLASDLRELLPIRPVDKVVDFGAATGGLVCALKKQGIEKVSGTDLSSWAVEWGRQHYGLTVAELQYYNRNLLCEEKDWVLALDVLEHCPNGELESILELLQKYMPKKGIAVRIPVSAMEGEDFVLDVSKNDRTHIQIHCKDVWKQMFEAYGMEEKKRLSAKTIYDSEGVYCAVFGKKKVEIRI